MNEVTRRSALTAAAAGIAGLTGTFLSAQDPPADGPQDMWRAWVGKDGDEVRLTVEGIYQNGGPGLVAVLKPAEPQGTNPEILLMELTVRQLPGVWPAVLIPIPASWTKSPYEAGRYESVSVKYPDGEMVTIERIIDADAEE